MKIVQEYNTYDRINLEELCNKILLFAQANKGRYSAFAPYTSRDSILKTILPYDKNNPEITKEWKTEIGYLNKLPSGNASINSLKILPREIENPEFRKVLMSSGAKLEKAIRSVQNRSGQDFLQELMDSCNSMFFFDEELRQIRECFAVEVVDTTNNFIGHLFYHAFSCVAFNLPHFSAKRVFHEALTLTPDSGMHIKLLRCSADSGNGYAALMYANHVYSKEPELALDYFLIASGMMSVDEDDNNGKPAKSETESNALWEIAFMFENHYLTESHIDYVERYVSIDKRLEDIKYNRAKKDSDENTLYTKYKTNEDWSRRDHILGFSFRDKEVVQITKYAKDECLKYALKLYLYIAKKDLTFPKAFNSLGKLILGEYISSIENVPQEPIEKDRFLLARNYLRTAIHFGNTNAMVNLAVYYHNQLRLGKMLSETEKQEMRYYLETAADFDEREAQQHLGAILMEEGNYDDAQAYLEYAANRNDKDACHSLGKVFAFNLDEDKAIECFEKAIRLKCYDAAYDLAVIYLLHKAVKTDKDTAVTYKQYAIHMIKDKYPFMSEEYRKKSKELLSEFGILLEQI